MDKLSLFRDILVDAGASCLIACVSALLLVTIWGSVFVLYIILGDNIFFGVTFSVLWIGWFIERRR